MLCIPPSTLLPAPAADCRLLTTCVGDGPTTKPAPPSGKRKKETRRKKEKKKDKERRHTHSLSPTLLSCTPFPPPSIRPLLIAHLLPSAHLHARCAVALTLPPPSHSYAGTSQPGRDRNFTVPLAPRRCLPRPPRHNPITSPSRFRPWLPQTFPFPSTSSPQPHDHDAH